MNALKKMLLVLSLSFLFIFATSETFAASTLYSGSVNWVSSLPTSSGSSINKVSITYTYASGDTRTGTFNIATTNANQILAMALTALSAGKRVQFQTDGATGTIFALYVMSSNS